MNRTSSVITGGVTVTAATLVPLVEWSLNGFPHPVPTSIPFLIAAGLVTGGHAIVNLYQARVAEKQAMQALQSQQRAAPAAPVAPQ